MSATKSTTQRNRELAAIHVLASKRLHLDRDTYVALLQRVGNVVSSADLDHRGRATVLDELRRLAGEGQQQMRNAVSLPDAPQNVRDELAAMVGKIGAILAEVDKSWAYAHGILFRLGSFWVGAHWSAQHKRLCINLIPCVTVWIVARGGDTP
ncbi:MAG: phage protein GemA/Gp16 family protein [Rhodanobacter sp.]